MWITDNLTDVLFWFGLLIVFPTTSYYLYSFSEPSIILWLSASASISAIIVAILSPFILIGFALLEALFKLILMIIEHNQTR